MSRLHRYLYLIILALALGQSLKAQDRCGTVQYNNDLKRKLGRPPANDAQFENWLKQKLTTLRSASTQRQKEAPYKIPVVVHVVHNGEAVGTGTNISDAQIVSQISVLNEDFRRQNADASATPSEFLTVAGSLDIEFVLAKRDPEGLPTNGIVRVKGSKTGWTLSDQYELKAQSYWPAEDYMNIWVCDQVDNLVGYGQYPESDLEGIDNSSINRLTDGLVVWYRAFGSSDDGTFDLSTTYNKGRTLTHELGHFLGLRHIWGDDSGSCEGDDFVTDTPRQAGSSSGCPSHPRSSCGTINMFQNFMDYTSDACMNLFTKQQVARMIVVLENSPRRKSLLTSQGLLDPVLVSTDLGIKSVLTPGDYQCSTTLSPSIEVRNYGSQPITSADIQLSINGVVTQTLNVSLNLNNLETTQVNFPSLVVPSGTNEIDFVITTVNGTTDQNIQNNTASVTFIVPQTTTTPFSENFNTFPTNWTIRNPDGNKTWEIATAPRESVTNKAMRLNLFDYEESYGEVDVLLSPVFDLSAAPVASIVFDVAFTRYLSSNDRLKVVLLRNCEDVDDGDIIYNKSGPNLRTVNSTTGAFVPAGSQDWRREFINITEYIGESSVQIAFVAVSDWGNNLYLDNISVLTTQLEDVELQGIESPSFITCEPTPTPAVVGQNIGTKIINSLTIQYSLNGVSQQFTANNLNVGLGEEFKIPLPPISLSAEENSVTITLINPNGQPDQSPGNNSKTFTILYDPSADKIPLRQNFDAGLTNWRVYNPEQGDNWEITNTNYAGTIYYNGFNNNTTNEIAWLVSPVLDFSSVTEASMVFDYSYRQRTGRRETLRLYGSRDCGNTFEEIVNVPLPTDEFQNAWTPLTDDDWQKDYIVNLTDYAGEPDVRIAFAVVNDNGNNLFLDNLEFFTAANPVLIQAEQPYNVYGYDIQQPGQSQLQITFNLPERLDVQYSIVDMMGKIQEQGQLYDVLNQTYRLDEGNKLATGNYIIWMKIGFQKFSERFLIIR